MPIRGLAWKDLVVEAYIDGDSELHLTANGLYWKEGGVSKPGKQDGNNFPTFIDRVPWMPEWGRPESNSGSDESKPLPLKLGRLHYNIETMAVGGEHDKNPAKLHGIEHRDPVTILDGDGEQVISIPRHAGGNAPVVSDSDISSVVNSLTAIRDHGGS